MRGVGIERLAPFAGEGHSHAEIAVNGRREIGDHQAARPAILALAHPGKDAAIGVVGDDPLESGRIAIQFMQRRHAAIERIEIANDGPEDQREVRPAASRKPGIGLANARAQLDKIYGGDYRLELATQPSGITLVTLDLPWRRADPT